MKKIISLIILLISFNASSAPIGFGDAELKLKPPIERDFCLNPAGETTDTIAAKGLTCLEWQLLPSDEISHYQITRGSNELVADVPHFVNYVDFIFADVVLPYGINNLQAVTFDTNGKQSKIKTFTIDMVIPKGNPKSLQEFSAIQKP